MLLCALSDDLSLPLETCEIGRNFPYHKLIKMNGESNELNGNESCDWLWISEQRQFANRSRENSRLFLAFDNSISSAGRLKIFTRNFYIKIVCWNCLKLVTVFLIISRPNFYGAIVSEASEWLKMPIKVLIGMRKISPFIALRMRKFSRERIWKQFAVSKFMRYEDLVRSCTFGFHAELLIYLSLGT